MYLQANASRHLTINSKSKAKWVSIHNYNCSIRFECCKFRVEIPLRSPAGIVLVPTPINSSKLSKCPLATSCQLRLIFSFVSLDLPPWVRSALELDLQAKSTTILLSGTRSRLQLTANFTLQFSFGQNKQLLFDFSSVVSLLASVLKVLLQMMIV